MGNIFYKNSLKITNIVRKAEFESFKLDSYNHEWVDIKALCCLPDQTLLVSTSNILVLFDSEFNIIKIIEEIEGHNFSCYGLATNNKNRIYLTNILNNKLIVTDYDFNIIKSFGNSNDNQFNRPRGLYFNKNLYICDTDNKRVDIFSENLNYIQSVNFSFKPHNIKTTNSTAFLIGEINGGKSWAFIYDINIDSILSVHLDEIFFFSQYF